jgi:hypothetical protein
MRHWRSGFLLFLLLYFVTGQVTAGLSPGVRICNNSPWVSPTGGDTLPSTSGTMNALTAAGQVRCARVTMQCSGTFTGLYFRVITGASTCGGGAIPCTCGAAIYSSDGTTKITATPETACATSATNIAVTGLTAFTLTAGTEYLACVAGASTGVSFHGAGAGSTNFGATLDAMNGASAAANLAQFNATCSALNTPYNPCCTGNGTGTCTGFPASLGTLASPGASTGVPYLRAQ